jgi:hypothetical protein
MTLRATVSTICLGVLLAGAGCQPMRSSGRGPGWVDSWRATNQIWLGVHLAAHTDEQAAALAEQLPRLKSVGVNVVIVEVDYSFDFQSHPELRPGRFMTRAGAKQLVNIARPLGIRLIPQINCLGHQSWSRNTGELLRHFPQFDETPGQYPDNEGIYCRSWCPLHPEVNGVIFALVDELADAFEADAFHVGMDEVFLIASEHCPRCRGGDPARLFARAVNDLHSHIVGKRHMEMLLWGDRLLDAKQLGYSKWEASMNGTAGSIDLIPKDIIVCDWHYGNQAEYPSVGLMLKKGFRVWPSGWQPLEASKSFSAFARRETNPRALGYLCTTWGKVKITELSTWPPLTETLGQWRVAGR